LPEIILALLQENKLVQPPLASGLKQCFPVCPQMRAERRLEKFLNSNFSRPNNKKKTTQLR
jgi:hypothetical protein